MSSARRAVTQIGRQPPFVLAQLGGRPGHGDAADLHILAIGVTALSLGAINCIFVKQSEVTTGVTYMTGILVKLGQGISRALLGERQVAWGGYLLLWLGLLVGAMLDAMLGAFVYPRMELAGLWIAASAAAVLAVVASKIELEHHEVPRRRIDDGVS